jgi:hypothetical protein
MLKHRKDLSRIETVERGNLKAWRTKHTSARGMDRISQASVNDLLANNESLLAAPKEFVFLSERDSPSSGVPEH